MNKNTSDFAITCILWGDKYDKTYVSRLSKALRKFVPERIPFYCLTNRSVEEKTNNIRWLPTEQAWWGWWQKICFFEKGFLPHRYLAVIDLDVIIFKDPSPIFQKAKDYDLVCAADLIDDLSSSFLIIDTHSRLAEDVWKNFDASVWVKPEDGDQDYLRLYVKEKKYKVLTLLPEEHYSYKYLIDHDCWRARASNAIYAPKNLKEITMLNFHGNPKPKHLFESPASWPLAYEIVPFWTE